MHSRLPTPNLVTPLTLPNRTLEVLRDDDPSAIHVVTLPGAAVELSGDLLMVEVAREAASQLVARCARCPADGTARTRWSPSTRPCRTGARGHGG